MKPSSNRGRKRVTFRLDAEPGREVHVAGSYDDWASLRPLTARNGDGAYTLTMYLAPGRYRYKFQVDGAWHIDPVCSHWETNPFGTLDSVLDVG